MLQKTTKDNNNKQNKITKKLKLFKDINVYTMLKYS